MATHYSRLPAGAKPDQIYSPARGWRDYSTGVGGSPEAVSLGLFSLFYLVEIRRQQLLEARTRTR
jgi:hypothetical protein